MAKPTSFLWRRANAVMLHPGRCGSTVVGEMLGAHPQISWAGEIFEGTYESEGAGQPGFARSHIEASCYSRLTSRYGFETKYLPQQHQLSAGCINMGLAQYLELLRGLRFSKFILLHRRNYLRRALSVEVGRTRGEWHANVSPTAATPVHLDVEAFTTGMETESLVESFRRMDESYALARRLLANDDVLSLVYEDDILADPTTAYRKSCAFLGVTPMEPKIVFVKTNPFAYEQMVANFVEVKSVLAGTPYEWMLHD